MTTPPAATAPVAAPPVTTAPAAPPPAATAPVVPAPAGVGGSAGTYAVSQEFDTPVAQGSWPSDGRAPSAYPNYLSYPDGTSGKYFPSKVLSVHDGVLDWYCHSSMAAAVLPFGYEGFTYGTYTVRMRADQFEQYHIAFLLWPVTNKWTHEIDGPEQETSEPKPYPAVLQSTSPSVRFQPAGQLAVPKSWNEFHDYTWQWAPGSLTFFQDGVEVTRVTSNVPDQPMRPVLQVEFSNRLAEGQKPDPRITGHVQVDRVAYDPSYTMAVPRS
ncbi:glycoside hydrolase family 16 protein [Modestobacter sp. VKM Ac-2986]|uniref:glycoside hydrolase family 16 protein n=1 Tax=Modestobacter sp. VKM Ac-2986 TaxID=3004140 RepID=UPI0022ABBFE4|nr:glycoside hydrolase family 16 protein [Modestobacter sp. VKM Ac-2986]MCZ2829862.1 glycoside hydrolase family 16 protein [Modestobacter sp. VKM Ac-2986]